jgi:hypothetical protein
MLDSTELNCIIAGSTIRILVWVIFLAQNSVSTLDLPFGSLFVYAQQLCNN